VNHAGVRWTLLLRPRWIAWHSIVILSCIGMLFLGDWQLHRAESGNQLSWAYTFEWPLFAAFTIFFWIKSLRDELRDPRDVTAAEPAVGVVTAAAASGSAAASAAPAATAEAAASVTDGPTTGSAQQTRNASVGRRADSWDSTSWNAASWDATGAEVGAVDAGKPVDVAHATPADGDAYVARLMAEVQRSGSRGTRR
jgi:hypothetical protein